MQKSRYGWRFFSLATMGLLVLSSMATAAPIPKSIPWDQTGPFRHVDGSGPHRDSHNLLLQARAAGLSASAATAESRDVGDVAVIVDDGTLIIPPVPPNLYDIPADTTISFVPGVGEFTVSSAPGGIVADPGGFSLGLTDDFAAPVEAVDSGAFAGFPFFGTTYGTEEIFVGSDGHITFGAGDGASTPRDAARHVGGPPRVSALLNDLNPDAGGDVRAEVNATSIVVTWDGVPQFGATNSNTVQAVLHSDGSIDLNYGSVDASTGVVGVAEGDDATPFTEIDYTTDLPGTFLAGAIFEEFTFGNPNTQMNTLGVAQRFLENHPDEFDFIVIFTDFVVDIGFGAFAFHQGIQNQTLGLGLRGVFDSTAVVESGATGDITELESVLNMNRIGLYWPDANKMVNPPIRKFRFFCGTGTPAGVVPCGATLDGPPGPNQISRRARWFGTLQGDFGARGSYTLGLNSAMSIMGQEAGHRWLAFPLFVHPTKGFNLVDNFDLLGRSNAHWSFFFNVSVPTSQFGGDPRASSMEGNAIRDLGGGLFLTEPNELIDGYTELDQYFMGLRAGGSVSPFWYVDDHPFPASVASLPAQDDILFPGTRVDLTVANITATQGVLESIFGVPPGTLAQFGPRNPAIGDEVDDCGVDVKTMAFVLLVPGDPSQHKSAIRQVDTFRATWEAYANGPATGGLGRFDTSLDPVCH